MNVAAGFGVAIREFKTDAGFADYLLYVNKKPTGVIDDAMAIRSLQQIVGRRDREGLSSRHADIVPR